MRSPAQHTGRKFSAAALVAVVALLSLGPVVACTGDSEDASRRQELTPIDGSSPEQAVTSTTVEPVKPATAEEYSQALLKSLTSDPDNAGLMNATEAACVAPKWIATITPARLGKAGVRPSDLETQKSMSVVNKVGLTVEEASGLVDEMKSCGVDVRRRWLATRDTQGQPVGAEVKACLEKKLTSELIDLMAAVGLSGDTSDPSARTTNGEFLAVLQACGVYPGGG